jgi:hypothetical protein
VRRNWISRSLASVLSLWLAVCLAEPVQLHTCAMHGGLAIVPVGAQAHASTGHHATRIGAGHVHHDQTSDNESRQCSCLGDCNTGSSPAGIVAARISIRTATVTEGSLASFTYASPRFSAPGFLLPFSNGPPAGSSRV